ncbi:MAG: MFS transporter, partial [Candidatus Dadabacteria bacterium]
MALARKPSYPGALGPAACRGHRLQRTARIPGRRAAPAPRARGDGGIRRTNPAARTMWKAEHPATVRPAIPAPFFVVALANFLFFLNFAFFFLLPIWVLRHGGGEEIAGRVVGISGFAGLAVLPAVGYLLDRFGRRRFMIAGALVSAAVSFAFMALDHIGPLLYVLRIVQGVAFTCTFTSAQTLAVLFAPLERRAEAIGWFGVSTILTHAISPALGEEIVRRFGFDAMFATGGTLALVAFGLACLLPLPPRLESAPGGRRPDERLVRRAVGTAALAMVCYGFGFGATQTFVPVLIERFHIGRVGAFFVAWSTTAVAVRIFFGSASDRYGRHAVLIPAMLTMSTAV